MRRYPKSLLTLISLLQKLPGVGFKTAERYAFQILNWQDSELLQLSQMLGSIKSLLNNCSECGCMIEENTCHFCDINKRNTQMLCVVSTPKDVYCIEETNQYSGLYHVLHGLLAPMHGQEIDKEQLDLLQNRIVKHKVSEIIIALDSTLEGDATALFLKEHLKEISVNISRLALGIPIGSSLDFVDEGTLGRAFSGRAKF